MRWVYFRLLSFSSCSFCFISYLVDVLANFVDRLTATVMMKCNAMLFCLFRSSNKCRQVRKQHGKVRSECESLRVRPSFSVVSHGPTRYFKFYLRIRLFYSRVGSQDSHPPPALPPPLALFLLFVYFVLFMRGVYA